MSDNITLLITIIPGLWVLWNYFFKRTFAPKIRMKLFGRIIGKDDLSQKILSVNLEIHNLGEVRLKSRKIELSVRGIEKNSIFKIGDNKILYQVNFDKKIYEQNIIPSNWSYTFIDANITQEYQYSIMIPGNIRYLLVESKIFFTNEDFQLTSYIIDIENENI